MKESTNKKIDCILYVDFNKEIKIEHCLSFGNKDITIVLGTNDEIDRILQENNNYINKYYIYNISNNSMFPLLDFHNLPIRVEPGAIIRDKVKLSSKCIILMGAIINTNAIIEDETMIDMGAVIGSGAHIGKRVHVGANAVIAGVMEPKSKKNVIIEDDVFIGAGAIILEGIRVGRNSVIGAGSVITHDIPEESVVVGVPGKIIKSIDKLNTDLSINKELRK